MGASPDLVGAPAGTMQSGYVLPSQYFGGRRKQAPEQRLMIAVLYDALACLAKYRFAVDRRGRRLFDEAREWFFADEPAWPYSFEHICAVLDLDAEAVRQRLWVAPAPASELGLHARRFSTEETSNPSTSTFPSWSATTTSSSS
jgi:hypothetical protein